MSNTPVRLDQTTSSTAILVINTRTTALRRREDDSPHMPRLQHRWSHVTPSPDSCYMSPDHARSYIPTGLFHLCISFSIHAFGHTTEPFLSYAATALFLLHHSLSGAMAVLVWTGAFGGLVWYGWLALTIRITHDDSSSEQVYFELFPFSSSAISNYPGRP